MCWHIQEEERPQARDILSLLDFIGRGLLYILVSVTGKLLVM